MSYKRPSQRQPCTLRPLSAELSPLHRSDGSASLKCGNTHIMAAVHGPIAPRVPNRERYDRGVVSVAFSKGLLMMANSAVSGGVGSDSVAGQGASGETHANNFLTGMTPLPVPLPSGGGATERELEYFVRDALSSCILLERYPRCVIQVVIQIVQADGGALGTSLNCAVLALMDAGVAMRGVPVASTCIVINNLFDEKIACEKMEFDGANESASKEVIWLDPTAEEESGEGHAVVVLVTDAAALSKNSSAEKLNSEVERIITSFTYGSSLSLSGLLASVASTEQSSAAMLAFMRLALEQKVQREAQTLWA
mmetsp:Transcript_21475/g.44665  ORF Transcript_21475/g.44665 Transcript_21475/m.44665 type:complete len:310 (+) Transcript_21475:181-1110(+)